MKYTFESPSILKRLSWKAYLTIAVACSLFFTVTDISSVSIPEFGKIYLWLGFLAVYVKLFVNSTPSWIFKLSKDAIPSKTGTVTSSKIEKTNDWFPNAPEEVATTPFFKVSDAGAGLILVVSTKKVTVAFAAFLDLGTYPIFLASATTFSLSVALSIKTSFATIFALYEVM